MKTINNRRGSSMMMLVVIIMMSSFVVLSSLNSTSVGFKRQREIQIRLKVSAIRQSLKSIFNNNIVFSDSMLNSSNNSVVGRTNCSVADGATCPTEVAQQPFVEILSPSSSRAIMYTGFNSANDIGAGFGLRGDLSNMATGDAVCDSFFDPTPTNLANNGTNLTVDPNCPFQVQLQWYESNSGEPVLVGNIVYSGENFYKVFPVLLERF